MIQKEVYEIMHGNIKAASLDKWFDGREQEYDMFCARLELLKRGSNK